MKRILSLIAIIALPVLAGAQTVTQVPNQLPPLSISDFLGVGQTNGWGVAVGDALAFVEGSTNAVEITAEPFALIGKSPGSKAKTWGGGLDVYAPIGGTNSAFGAGFGLAYFNHSFYDATLNAKLGQTYSLPVIKLPVYAYIESGGGYNIGKNTAIAQAFAGATLPIAISTKWSASVGGAIGTISDFTGSVLAIGGSVTYKF